MPSDFPVDLLGSLALTGFVGLLVGWALSLATRAATGGGGS